MYHNWGCGHSTGEGFHGLPCSGLGVQEDIADRWFEVDGCSMEWKLLDLCLVFRFDRMSPLG